MHIEIEFAEQNDLLRMGEAEIRRLISQGHTVTGDKELRVTTPWRSDGTRIKFTMPPRMVEQTLDLIRLTEEREQLKQKLFSLRHDRCDNMSD